MKICCIQCGEVYGEKESPIFGKDEETSGLCRGCRADIFKEKQRRQGNYDCFGSAIGDCDQAMCRYRGLCVR